MAAWAKRVCTLWAALCLSGAAVAPAGEDEAFFESRIRPVLVDKCYSCHGGDEQKTKGGLRLDTRAGMRSGGDSGPAVAPGKPADSLLLAAIKYEGGLEMPPKERLPASVVADFERWIARGASDPRDGPAVEASGGIDLGAGRRHWAFQPLADPPIPAVRDTAWPRTDIDRFILAALEASGLHPRPDAAAEVLQRRLAFDLTGLPPASAATDNQPRALLQSPRFGERWARHWLDVARYAESSGGAHNVVFPLAFRYRDYVIDAFNADKPYDQFIREQLAGDLLPAADDAQRNEQLTATGFLCVGVKDLRENDHHRFRMALADEQIDAVSRTFLGLTLACAKCHDHKFDPISTADYYSLAGIFISSEPMLGARRNRQRHPLAAGLLSMAGAPVTFGDDEFAALLKSRVDLTYKRLAVRDEKYRLLSARGATIRDLSKHEAFLNAAPSVQQRQQEADAAQAEYEALQQRYDAALPYSVMGMREDAPQDCAVHIRGEDTQLGPVVKRGFPLVLQSPQAPTIPTSHSGRLELAEWIASPAHPLTARVLVNRIWQRLFGQGLVDTPDDFGHTGAAPTNPALLDFLARRLIAHKGSVKRLIGEIVASRVYQLDSGHDPKAVEIDPANRLHWRMNRRRLDSDALFDSLRMIGGELVLERPPAAIRPTPVDDRVKSQDLRAWFAENANRRTIYQPILRDHLPDDWRLFDFPDPELVTGKRNVTTVPTQALFLMNSPFVAEQAKKTAALLLREHDQPQALVRAAHLRILQRTPSPEVVAEGAAFLQAFPSPAREPGMPAAAPVDAAAALCQSLFASAEFLYLY